MTPQKKFGKLLKEARRRCTNRNQLFNKKNISQADFAELLSYRVGDGTTITHATIGHYERGVSSIGDKNPRPKLLAMIHVAWAPPSPRDSGSGYYKDG